VASREVRMRDGIQVGMIAIKTTLSGATSNQSRYKSLIGNTGNTVCGHHETPKNI
jgi:hypothetical protein